MEFMQCQQQFAHGSALGLRNVHLELDSPWVNQGVGENPIDSPRVNQIQRAHAEAIMVPTAPIVALGGGIRYITWMHKS